MEYAPGPQGAYYISRVVNKSRKGPSLCAVEKLTQLNSLTAGKKKKTPQRYKIMKIVQNPTHHTGKRDNVLYTIVYLHSVLYTIVTLYNCVQSSAVMCVQFNLTSHVMGEDGEGGGKEGDS